MSEEQKEKKPEEGTPGANSKENEIKVKANGELRNYIKYAKYIFEKQNYDTLHIRASGNAITKAVILSEILREDVTGLYSEIEIKSESVTDKVKVPTEDQEIEQHKNITVMTIQLTKNKELAD